MIKYLKRVLGINQIDKTLIDILERLKDNDEVYNSNLDCIQIDIDLLVKGLEKLEAKVNLLHQIKPKA